MRVKIFQDLVCPWCYIGKSRFDEALEIVRRDRPSLHVEVSYGPFQLDPHAPVGLATPVIDAYAAKFGGPDKARAILDRVSAAAREAGLDINMDIARRANTRLAHRVILAAEGSAAEGNVADRLINALYRAYFVEGRDISDPVILRLLATTAGMDSATVDAVLDGDALQDRFDAELVIAADRGITAVPTFVIEDQWAVSGAQESAFFVRVLSKLADA